MEISEDPVVYPKIRLRCDRKEYELRFPLDALIRLKKEQGIDVAQKSELVGVDALERMLVMVQVGISHSRQISIEELSKQVDLRDMKYVGDLMTEALKPVSQAIAETSQPERPQAIQ